MILENKLNITDQIELVKTEEKISKQKASMNIQFYRWRRRAPPTCQRAKHSRVVAAI